MADGTLEACTGGVISRRVVRRADGSVTSTFACILRKELREHFRSVSVTAGIAVLVVIGVATAWLRATQWRGSHNDAAAHHARWHDAVREQIMRGETIEVESVRDPSPLSVISVGLEPVSPSRFVSTKEGLRFGPGRASTLTSDVLTGYLDLSFVVTVFLSLFAMGIAFNTVSGERADGTLLLMLSYPVKRSWILLAKGLAALTIVTLTLAIIVAGAFFTCAIQGIPTVFVVPWPVFLLTSVVYLAFFVASALAVSATHRRAMDAALTCIAIWVGVIFVVPRAEDVVLNATSEKWSTAALRLQEDIGVSRLRLRYRLAEQRAYRELINSGGNRAMASFLEWRAAATRQMRREREDLLRRLWREEEERNNRRQRLLAIVQAFSPTSLFASSAADLARTGSLQERHFLSEARGYDISTGRALAESEEMLVGVARNGQISAMIASNGSVRALPFRERWVSDSAVAQVTIPRLVFLSAFAVASFVVAVVQFMRMDVR